MKTSIMGEQRLDYQLLGLTLLLTLFGLVMLSSASSVLGYERFGDTYFFTKQQAVHIVLGLIALAAAARIPPSWWRALALPGFLVTLALLVLVFIPGVGLSGNNLHSWVSLGPLNFQPSEFAKLGFLLYLAAWLEKRREHLGNFSYGFIPFLVLVGILAGLVLLQPDVGTVALIIITSIALYFVAGAKLRHLIIVGALACALLAAAVLSAPYRIERFLVLLDPGRDPGGVGYHVRQAMIAIGSGGWRGSGLGQSRQKYNYLPETAGDSIFAVMGEELGFLFTTAFVILLSLLVYRLMRCARTAPTDMGRCFIAGVALWIAVQSLFNIGAMIGILPLTGVPLPFVSFGGSAILSLLAAVGVCLSLSRTPSRTA